MDIKGHTVEVLWIEKAARHRRGVLRHLHPRPRRQAPPRHALGPGWRGDRGRWRRTTPTPWPRSTSTRSTASPRRSAGTGWPRPSSNPARHRGRGRHPPASCTPAYVERRRRPGGDQPADPQARRARSTPSTPRSRLDDNAALPPPRLRATTRPPRCATSASELAHEQGLQYVGLDGFGRRDRQRRRARHEHGRHRQPGRRQARPTSSTSAAAPTPT